MAILTKSPEESLQLGESLGKHLRPGDIVLLFGDLGAGKTTFTQGICQGSGLPEGEYIRSPTFTLINEYQAACPIYHIDLYRLDTSEEMAGLGLEEVLFGDGISIVEWADKLISLDPGLSLDLDKPSRIEVRISYTDEYQRSFSIEAFNMGARSFPVFPLH